MKTCAAIRFLDSGCTSIISRTPSPQATKKLCLVASTTVPGSAVAVLSVKRLPQILRFLPSGNLVKAPGAGLKPRIKL